MKLSTTLRFARGCSRHCTTAAPEKAAMASPTARYLVYFQYLGTKYSGVMAVPPSQAVLGVQNYLEKAAEMLRPSSPIKFIVSSRTDSGVHALRNAAHIDIERKPERPPFPEDVLVKSLNCFLKSEPIRILGVRRVPDTFHARFSALSRTYIYRVATGCSSPFEMPVFEQNLCWATCRGHLNFSAMREAAAFLVGTHDFRTFRSANKERPVKDPYKTLMRAEVRPSSGFLLRHNQDSQLRFWELEFQAPSFLYKQVRRMVGVLVAVGQNRLQPHHVKSILEARDLMAYPPNTIAPAHGLFLKEVEYREADLEMGTTEAEQQSSWMDQGPPEGSSVSTGNLSRGVLIVTSCGFLPWNGGGGFFPLAKLHKNNSQQYSHFKKRGEGQSPCQRNSENGKDCTSCFVRYSLRTGLPVKTETLC